MKHESLRRGRTLVALLLAVSMVFGMCSTVFATMDGSVSVGTGTRKPGTPLNYVSIGDSMANGYCFTGYEQGSRTTAKYDFLNGVGVYGNSAYPLQFAEWLADLDGVSVVNHTMLAPSALLPEDLLYLLDGGEKIENEWAGYEHYVGDATDEQLKELYQTAVTEADVITLGIGNATFGAYLLDRVTSAVGIMGSAPNTEMKVNLELALSSLDAEEKEIVLDIYGKMMAKLKGYVPAELMTQFNVEKVCDIVAYAAASFLLCYKDSVTRIVELNPDVEIVLVGLMNTTYGMNIIAEGIAPIPFGDIMDEVFGILNSYMAGLPTVMQASGEWTNAKFFYAEQPAPKFICQVFDDLKDASWGVIDKGRLDGAIVRSRNISAYNEMLMPTIGNVFASIMGYPTVSVTNEMVEKYEALNGDFNAWYGAHAEYYGNVEGYIAASVYLAIEDAVAASTETMDIPLEGLTNIAGGIESLFTSIDLPITGPQDIRPELAKVLIETPALNAMSKIYGLFKVGNGMSVHPTPAGHDEIAKAVISAYENGFTAQDKTKQDVLKAAKLLADLVAEYYDEAYAYGYQYAVNNGYIAQIIAALDNAEAQLASIEALVANQGATEQFMGALKAEIAEAKQTIAALRTLILTADQLDQETLDKAIALLDELEDNLGAIKNMAAIAGSDLYEQVIRPELIKLANKLWDEYQNNIRPAIIQMLQDAVDQAIKQLKIATQQAYDALIEATKAAAQKYVPMACDAIYDYLYNNPEEVIAFFAEYGDDIVGFLAENLEYILPVLAFIAVNYGEEILAFILENREEILDLFVEWYKIHGENTWALIMVYLDELGILDMIDKVEDDLKAIYEDIMDRIDAVKKQIAAQIAQVEEQLKKADAATKAMLTELYEKLVALYDALVELENALEAAVENGIAAAVEAAQKALQNVTDAAAELVGVISAEAAAAINGVVNDVKEMLNDLYSDVVDKVEKIEEDLKNLYDAIEEQAKEVIGGVYNEITGRVDAIKAQVAALIAEVNEMLKSVDSALVKETLTELYEKLINLYEAILDLENVLDAAVEGGINAAISAAQAAVQNIVDAAADLVGVLSDEAASAITGVVNDVKDMLNNIYIDAITDTYASIDDSYYVALGDSSAMFDPARESYVSKVAFELAHPTDATSAPAQMFVNLAQEGLAIEDTFAVISQNAAYIANADLVTIGFSNNPMIEFVTKQLNLASKGQAPLPMDWSKFVGNNYVGSVQQVLDKIKGEIAASGIDEMYAGWLTLALESYAYGCVNYMFNYPQLVDAIHQINPEALVIIVGMYNPLKDMNVILPDKNFTAVPVGDYVQYLVDLANFQTTVLAMIAPNTIYVDAPDVEIQYSEKDLSIMEFISLYISAVDQLYATADGHTYIAEKILGALDLTVDAPKGDANRDGVVDSYDAALILQLDVDMYEKGDIAYLLCDVSGDGIVDSYDAALILQFDVGLITEFPSAN